MAESSKEYLKRARYIDRQIKTKIDQIAVLNDLATSCTKAIDGMPRNPSPVKDRNAEAVVKIVDLQREIQDDMVKLVEIKENISKLIKAIENPELQMLLEKRYLCFKTWEEVAVDMCYEIRYIHKLHNKALIEFDRIRKKTH